MASYVYIDYVFVIQNYIDVMVFDSLLDSCYDRREYPALNSLMARWECTRPFTGMQLLVATPVFRNTLLQYRALMAGGAKLWIGSNDTLCDKKIVGMLKDWGFPVVDAVQALDLQKSNPFDLILDCAGRFSACSPRFGFVELTRSGVQFYEGCPKPVYVADSGIVKRIETSLGTGEGYVRGLAEAGYPDIENKKFVVFGSGKVGSGIALQLLRAGASLEVVTDVSLGANPFHDSNGIAITDCRNVSAVADLVRHADFVVTATGIKDALDVPELTAALMETKAVLANMGVEDEYGAGIPAERVLAGKNSLNFILEEPTHLKYIDASLALHVALGELLVKEYGLQKSKAPFTGTRNPPEDLEREILSVTMQDGLIGPEIAEMLGGLSGEP